MIQVWCDGLCEPRNPGGMATWGYVIYRDGERLLAGKGVVGEGKGMTANVAEYTALIEAMRWLLGAGYQKRETVLHTDSQMAVRQLEGEWAVKSHRIRSIHKQAKRLKWQFRKIRFVWVPRRQNEEADALSVEAYVEAREEKRRERAAAVALERHGPNQFLANGKYSVDTEANTCTCPDYKRRHSARYPIRCKHLLAALPA